MLRTAKLLRHISGRRNRQNIPSNSFVLVRRRLDEIIAFGLIGGIEVVFVRLAVEAIQRNRSTNLGPIQISDAFGAGVWDTSLRFRLLELSFIGGVEVVVEAPDEEEATEQWNGTVSVVGEKFASRGFFPVPVSACMRRLCPVC